MPGTMPGCPRAARPTTGPVALRSTRGAWDDDVSEVLFHAAKWIHIAAGAFAALFLFPLQFFASPGGPAHRGRRRLITIVTLVIAIGGLSILVHPEFSGFWKEESEKLGYGTY